MARTIIALKDGWEFRAKSTSAPEGTRSWSPAQPIPSTVHQDLLAINAIPDPFLAKNEAEVQWVGEQAWTYRKNFTVPHDARRDLNVQKHLVFEGLDTYATVWLNGKEILKSENMFVTHRIDVSDVLLDHEGSNLLEVAFDNAEQKGDEEVAQHPNHVWGTFNSGEARLATRKAQYHYGWDWGPKLMTCGLWKPAYLELFQSRISDLSAQVSLSPNLQEADIHVALEASGRASHAVIELQHEGTTLASKSVQIKPKQASNTTISVKQPKLWWPHTFGEQHMYNLKATIYASEDDKITHDTTTRRIGLRKIELVQHPFSEQEGTSFYFKVNNIPIFSAGSNWIPGHSFLPQMTPSTYQKWVLAAKESNQVMIRAWGGGVYEDESFYDACDEQGILVWQDFMFACGMFPAYKSFLDKIEVEVRDNLRKLRHHPCVALWCANNEDYVIPLLSGIEYDAEDKDPESILKSTFPARYTYEHLLPKLCKELVPDTPYWPGSPFGGSMCNSPTEGDIHQWHVWHLEKFPYQDFPRLSGRFVSEFGMQAMPSLRTAQEFFPADDKLLDGRDYSEDEFVQYHNKCGGGAETLHKYCEDNLPLEKHSLSKYIYCTQLLQSETVATAFRSWKRLWRGNDRDFCGGALIWQLNDCYPVTSWSLIDSNLRPKMSFWATKRENKPITAGLQRVHNHGNTHIEVWAVNTTLRVVTVDVQVRAWNVAGGKALWSRTLHSGLRLPSNQSLELGVIDPNVVGLKSSQHYKDVVFVVDLIEGRSGEDSITLDHTINFHEPLKEVSFVRPTELQVKIVSARGDTFVELKSPCALKGVLLEVTGPDTVADEVTWDDNGFDTLPDQVLRAKVSGLRVGNEDKLKAEYMKSSS
ncbi:glycoside hydrolase family 2 protein [Zasmidium cellare ATCC 36951]|uniref:Beta-mannosidase B n=1 Tax=Zasmidium cellare ATCC 36951 TaxID=1080233 RepID=A0A6A6D696_ZASCE|nr:glycoside hydrolase family 2 protein [Zasmidium cellare ATCC 36951]KAF2173742.1 glycoside hydrolase family 2 protein [Zasmidium cellare ATCC 36951]